MNEILDLDHKERTNLSIESENRKQLLAGLPVKEYRQELAGISTAILEGGEGPPMILLHGPGENVTWWRRAIPKLVESNRIIIPDLPGHGASRVANGTLDAVQVLHWLEALIKQTSRVPPVLVGHVLGGAIATRFVIERENQISQLVLVDSLGLGKFRPSLRFALGLFRFMMRPTKKNYDRFLPQCIYDKEDLQKKMGKLWNPFLAYNLECVQDKDQMAALQTLMKQVGIPRIPPEHLAMLKLPIDLIWGRHDQANKLKIAEAASEQFGWPLYIIEDSRDDPKLEQPDSFVNALHSILGRPASSSSVWSD